MKLKITIDRLRVLEKELGKISSEYLMDYCDDGDIVIVAMDSNGVLKYFKNGFGWGAYLESWSYGDGYKRIPVNVCNTIPEVLEQIWYTKGIKVKLPIKLERELKND